MDISTSFHIDNITKDYYPNGIENVKFTLEAEDLVWTLEEPPNITINKPTDESEHIYCGNHKKAFESNI